MTVLRDGYRVPFTDSPPLSRTPVSFPTYWAGSPRAHALRQEVEAMLDKGALEIALDLGPGFYSRLFLVEKASGGWWPVISLSHLNEFVQLTRFKMETVASVLLSVREWDFLASLDLKDVYFQIPIHPYSKKLLRFMLEGDGLPVPSPVFQAVDPSPGLHQGLCSCVSVGTLSRAQASTVSGRLVGSCLFGAGGQAGSPVPALALSHPRDCDKREEVGMPSQTAKYLGMTIDTEAGKVFPSLARVEKFLMVAESFCAMDAPPAQLWQVMLGHLALLEWLVPHVCLQMRSLQWHLKAHWSPESDPPFLPVPLPQEARRDLSWWMVRDHLLTGVRFGTPAPDLSHVFGRVLFGVGHPPPRSTRVRGVDGPGKVVTHQSSRDESSVLGSAIISRRCHRPSCDSDVRQLDGRGVCQQAGGHGFPGPMLVNQPTSEMDGESRHPSRCEVSSRSVQCPGRSPQPPLASCRDRVVSSPSGGEVTASPVGQSVAARPLRDEPQRETAPLLLVCPGSPGRLRGRVSSSLG